MAAFAFFFEMRRCTSECAHLRAINGTCLIWGRVSKAHWEIRFCFCTSVGEMFFADWVELSVAVVMEYTLI